MQLPTETIPAFWIGDKNVPAEAHFQTTRQVTMGQLPGDFTTASHEAIVHFDRHTGHVGTGKFSINYDTGTMIRF